ncbi:genetic competence negative regulator [Oceanobacillus sp. J11TS1]|uniref:genetic competence negative regulator n=1 Tax=Oceanobacillus sp. J11TS1 TaxID=2807191 RepID=UPI001B2282CE|nr:genetic competence negative regulator [Oceanobacillus sp. J11TS1]GIO22599.1 adapter protein MecA 2 [Oceanobacillus sp. J11TS1]
MRIERISTDQFKIFLTFDDLIERGFTREDLWHDASNVRTLFSDMMYEASSELDMEFEGMLLVQVHLMQAQGMHIFVTHQYEDIELDNEYIEMKVTLDESKELIFSFDDFEEVIAVAGYLSNMNIKASSVYYMENRYFMLLDPYLHTARHKENIIAVMSEFAHPSILTSHRIKEYGKAVFNGDAISKINQYFAS